MSVNLVMCNVNVHLSVGNFLARDRWIHVYDRVVSSHLAKKNVRVF